MIKFIGLMPLLFKASRVQCSLVTHLQDTCHFFCCVAVSVSSVTSASINYQGIYLLFHPQHWQFPTIPLWFEVEESTVEIVGEKWQNLSKEEANTKERLFMDGTPSTLKFTTTMIGQCCDDVCNLLQRIKFCLFHSPKSQFILFILAGLGQRSTL